MIANTHAPTHNKYSLKILVYLFLIILNRIFLKLIDLLKIADFLLLTLYQINVEKNKKFKNNIFSELLFHGTRMTNFVGILSNGLKIAPSDAPITGYMFG